MERAVGEKDSMIFEEGDNPGIKQSDELIIFSIL